MTTAITKPVLRSVPIDDAKHVVAIDARGVFVREHKCRKWRAVSWQALKSAMGEPGEHAPMTADPAQLSMPFDDAQFAAQAGAA